MAERQSRRSTRRQPEVGLTDSERRVREGTFWQSRPDPSQIERQRAIEITRQATQPREQRITIAPLTYNVDIEGNQSGHNTPTPMGTQPNTTNPQQNTPPRAPAAGEESEVFSTPATTPPSRISHGDLTHSQMGPTPPQQSTHNIESTTNVNHLNTTITPQGQIQGQGNITNPNRTSGDTLSRGTISPPFSQGMGEFMDETHADVMRTSMQGNPGASWNEVISQPTQPISGWMPLSWIIPDGTNTQIEEAEAKTIANFASPGGGRDAMILILETLHPYFDTSSFLADLGSGELFAQVNMRWHPTGIWCGRFPFNLQELQSHLRTFGERFRTQMASLVERGQSRIEDLREENSTQFMQLPASINEPQPPPLPRCDSPSRYPRQSDTMRPRQRRNYIRARQQAATIYIMEYNLTRNLISEGKFNPRILEQRLELVYERVNRLKQTIDIGLEEDDRHRRNRVMRGLGTPTRFPDPNYMSTSQPREWIRWINEEIDDLDREIQAEISSLADPNDPFNGTAGGIFSALPRDNSETREEINHTTQNTNISTHEQLPQRTRSRNTTTNETNLSHNNTRRRLYNTETTAVPNTNRADEEMIGARGDRPSGGQPNPQETNNRPIGNQLHPDTMTSDTVTSNNNSENRQPNTQHITVPTNPVVQGEGSSQYQQSNRVQPNTTTQGEDSPHYHEKGDNNSRPRDDTGLIPEQPTENRQEQGQTRYYNNNNQVTHRPSEPIPNNNTEGTTENTSNQNRVRYNLPQENRTQGRYGDRPDNPQWRGQTQDVRYQQDNRTRGIHTQHPRANQQGYNYNMLDETRDNMTCTRCGVRGHISDFCSERVFCNWCTRRSHNTVACRKYAEFVKKHPLSSSRRPSPDRTNRGFQENFQTSRYPPQYDHQDVNPLSWNNHQNRRVLPPDTQRQLENIIRNSLQVPNIDNPVTHQPGNRRSDDINQGINQAPTGTSHQSLETRFQTAGDCSNIIQTTLQRQQELTSNYQEERRQQTTTPYANQNPTQSIRNPPDIRNESSQQVAPNRRNRDTQTEAEPRPVFVNNYYTNNHNAQNPSSTTARGEYSPQYGYPTTTNLQNKVDPTTYYRYNTTSQGGRLQTEASKEPTSSTKETDNTENKKEENKLQLPDTKFPPPPSVVLPVQPDYSGLTDTLKDIAMAIQQQLTITSAQSQFNTQQSSNMLEKLIQAQERRDLDPALMAIPTFSGSEPEKCMEWIQRIKNVCKQSGRSLRQELTNKSELLVQNFIQNMDPSCTDEAIIEKLLEHFSDVQTTAQATQKLMSTNQGHDESILAFNQRYRMLVNRVDQKEVDSITAVLQMQMYLNSIQPKIAKSIKGNIFYKSKHAPTTLGEAMKKAEENYMKEIYTSGGNDIEGGDQFGAANREVEVQNVDTGNRGYRGQSNYSNQRNDRNWDRRYNNQRYDRTTEQQRSQLPRGSYTQILVNPMQLEDEAFTVWMERLVEAKKRRQSNDPRPYRNFRKPYVGRDTTIQGEDSPEQGTNNKPQLRKYIKPATELNVEEIQKNFQCTYEDIEEACDLYNLDVADCQSA